MAHRRLRRGHDRAAHVPRHADQSQAGARALPQRAGRLRLKVGNGRDPSAWADAPDPSYIHFRPGAGFNGSDRFVLTWPDGAIKNTWLQVTIPATAQTGLAQPDVFYVGNLAGETGDAETPLRVSALDLVATRRALFSAAPIASAYDVNRDGRASALDLAVVRANLGRVLAPPAPPAAAESVLRGRAWEEVARTVNL